MMGSRRLRVGKDIELFGDGMTRRRKPSNDAGSESRKDSCTFNVTSYTLINRRIQQDVRGFKLPSNGEAPPFFH